MKKGFTVIELMIGMIIFSLVLTALWQVYSGSQRNAREIIANHTINDELDRTLLKIMDDVRESNFIFDNCPEAIAAADVNALKTKRENYLMFMKVLYDFSKDPMDLPAGEVNYTQNKVEYYLEKEDDASADSNWILFRRMIPYDNKRQPVPSQETIFEVLKGVKECVFYRLKDPEASRSGNVYIRLKLARNDVTGPETGKYSNEITISVKERGVSPE